MTDLPIGMVCGLIDNIDESIITNCTIKAIEPDMDIPGLVYYYLMANNEALNDKTDPRFPWRYFDIVDNTTDRLFPLEALLTD